MQKLGTVAEQPSGAVPIIENRFGTRDIQLSSALCALGFALKLESQPATITIDANEEKRFVTFFHESTTKLGNFQAFHVELWWNSPEGKYSIEGYDDALSAMRKVHISRRCMLEYVKRPLKFERSVASVATQSLHSASILNACEIPLLGYEPSTRQWIFGKGAELILTLIKSGGKPKDKRPLENDLCIDWMLESLRYRDFLAKLIRNPDCIPLVQMREGEKVLQMSQAMNKKDAARMINRL